MIIKLYVIVRITVDFTNVVGNSEFSTIEYSMVTKNLVIVSYGVVPARAQEFSS